MREDGRLLRVHQDGRSEGPSFLEAGIQTGAYVEGIQKSRGIDLAVSKLNFGGGSGSL